MTNSAQRDLFATATVPTVMGIIRTVLNGAARPSARELLRHVERQLEKDVHSVFENAVRSLTECKELRRSDQDYLRGMLTDGSLAEALRGKGATDDETVSSIDALLRQSATYRSSAEFRQMVEFMGRFRDYSPYNVMLVRLQNPSCGFFATERDWLKRHKRTLVEDARPMLILAPMHPVLLVYELDQTQGSPLPDHLNDFAHFEGKWNPKWLSNLVENAQRHRLRITFKTLSSTYGGFATNQSGDATSKMRIAIHDKLDEPSRFGVLVHEIAHVLLGHLGTDYDHWWPGRFNLDSAAAEIEAETVAHIVTSRLGLSGSSAAYLSGYVDGAALPQSVSMDLIAKVAGRIEEMAKGLQAAPKPRPPKQSGKNKKA
jgi:hypothetical protein